MSAQTEDDQLRDKAASIEGEFIAAGGGDDAGAESAAPRPSTGTVLTALLRPTFDMLAPAWNVSDDECRMLGEAYGVVIDKYFPNFDLGLELAAVFVTFAVFGPRMRKPRHTPKQSPDAEAETRPG